MKGKDNPDIFIDKIGIVDVKIKTTDGTYHPDSTYFELKMQDTKHATSPIKDKHGNEEHFASILEKCMKNEVEDSLVKNCFIYDFEGELVNTYTVESIDALLILEIKVGGVIKVFSLSSRSSVFHNTNIEIQNVENLEKRFDYKGYFVSINVIRPVGSIGPKHELFTSEKTYTQAYDSSGSQMVFPEIENLDPED